MPPRLGQGEIQFLVAQLGGDEAAAGGAAHRLDRADIGGGVEAEGHDAVGIRPGRRDQPVAVRTVIGNDRGAAGLKPLENLALGIGNGGFFRKNSVCAGAMAVTIAMCGRTIAVSADSSPAWFIPISNTPAWQSRGIRARLKGTPVWLL